MEILYYLKREGYGDVVSGPYTVLEDAMDKKMRLYGQGIVTYLWTKRVETRLD